MPNPPPKSYGAPMGPQAAAPGAQRNVARAPTAEQIHAALDAREKQIAREYAAIQHVRKKVPKGSSQSAAPPAGQRGGANLRVEKALKDAGA